MIFNFHYTDSTSNPQLGSSQDSLSKNLSDFVKIPLSSMPYLRSAHVIPTGIKLNHIQKGLDENLVF